jgi:aminopeptidase-like protein
MAIDLAGSATEHQRPGTPGESAEALYALVKRLYPICRSITGDGVRQTLRILGEYVPLAIHEVPTGTPVFDWEVPREWNIRDAYIKGASGRRVVDFNSSSLHVVSYSTPVHATLSLDELRPHLHTLPDRPDWIPYRTSYWKEYWGFCVAHNVLLQMQDARYEACIESTLQDGHLTYAERLVPGESEEEVLLFSHTCHPSMCNDNCTGLAVTTFLARRLGELSLRYSYRFVWAPSTIGSITWLSRNQDAVSRVRHGLVLTGFGDPGPFTYKRSRRGNAAIDRIVPHVILGHDPRARIDDFSVYGYDERQFCSPGFNLPVGRLTRTPYGEYPEYHTSADDLHFIAPERLSEALAILLQIVDAIESSDRRYMNTCPHGEPRLGKRGLFRPTGGAGLSRREEALLWLLNFSDGSHSVLDIAERSKLDLRTLAAAVADLVECGLLIEANGR